MLNLKTNWMSFVVLGGASGAGGAKSQVSREALDKQIDAYMKSGS